MNPLISKGSPIRGAVRITTALRCWWFGEWLLGAGSALQQTLIEFSAVYMILSIDSP